jgi:L,D-peptidoglycan transpeptidase YkuD (ErfK/YbiS/YcfS/YnhG family)
MIIVKKNSYLKYKNFRFRCAIGKAGIKKKLTEGDNITPTGTYKLINIFYRPDRIKELKTHIKKIKITKTMGWCDDVNSKYYNKKIELPNKSRHEKLYRKDNIYDIIGVLNYNIHPVIKNKGSAIFLHIAKKNYQKTKGCIAIKKIHLKKILSVIGKNTKIRIE